MTIFFESHARTPAISFMFASPFCLLAFAREIKKLCIVLYLAGGFRIKLSVSFVFKLERLSSDFVFTFSKLLKINYFHTCEVLFLKGRKLRSREYAFRDNNTHSVSGSNTMLPPKYAPKSACLNGHSELVTA